MDRRCFIAACLTLVGTMARTSRAQASHTEADVIRLVDHAADYLRTHTRREALAAFSDAHGEFRDGDLYLYVLDAADDRLVMLAHGANSGLVGMPQRDIVDAEGKDFNAATVVVTRGGQAGWVDYKWPNPVTHKIAAKSSYVRRVDDVIIGAGLYR